MRYLWGDANTIPNISLFWILPSPNMLTRKCIACPTNWSCNYPAKRWFFWPAWSKDIFVGQAVFHPLASQTNQHLPFGKIFCGIYSLFFGITPLTILTHFPRKHFAKWCLRCSISLSYNPSCSRTCYYRGMDSSLKRLVHFLLFLYHAANFYLSIIYFDISLFVLSLGKLMSISPPHTHPSIFFITSYSTWYTTSPSRTLSPKLFPLRRNLTNTGLTTSSSIRRKEPVLYGIEMKMHQK